MKIEFNLNLQRLSLLRAAQAAWDSEDIRNEIIKFFLTTKIFERKDEWILIIKKALRKIPTSLPSVLRCELLYAVKSTGLRIYDWFFYLRNIKFFSHNLSMMDYDKYLKKIYWTHYGTIDEVKTLKYFWLNNPNIERYKVFDLACCFCAKDVIVDMWENKSRRIDCEQNCHLYKNYKSHILVYWIHRQNSTLDTLMEKINSHNGDLESIYETIYSIEENMLRMAVRCGYHLAVQYFWNLLNDEQRERNAFICLQSALRFRFLIVKDQQDRNIEICIFLFNNVTEETKIKIFQHEYWSDGKPKISYYMRTFIAIFMNGYPWQDFVAPVVMELKKYSIFSGSEYHSIFGKMTRQIISDSDIGLPVENSAMQRQFCLLWRIIPSHLKSSIASDVLYNFLDLWNIKLIKCIVYDIDLKAERMTLITESYEKCKYLYDNEGNEMFDELVDHLLIFDDWEDEIKILMKKLYMLLKNFKLNEATDLFYSEPVFKKKKITKSMIDHSLLCYFFIKKNLLDCADKVLWWALDFSDVAVRDFKKKLNIKRRFSRSYIYSLWLNAENSLDFLKAETLSTKYLHCFLDLNGSDEITSFISEIIGNLKSFTFTEMETFFITKNKFKALTKFLGWCNDVSNEYYDIKDEFVNEGCVEKMCKRYVEENDLHSTEQLLKWAYTTDSKVLTFKYNFMTSDKGIKILKYFIATANSSEINLQVRRNQILTNFKSFIDFWIKPLSNFGEIVKTLNAWNKSVGQKYHDDLDDLIDSNLHLEEEKSTVSGFGQYISSPREHLFWQTGNYVLFMRMLGCSHCHFMKSLTRGTSDDLNDD